MADDIIEVIPKTEFAFDGRASTTQDVVLAERIRTLEYGSGALEVLLLSQSDLTGTASASITVHNQSEEPEDRATVLTSTTASASVILNSATPTPSLVPAVIAAPIGAMVRVRLRWSQGTTAATDDPQKITIAVNLVMRMGA